MCLLPELQRLKIEQELTDGETTLSKVGQRIGADASSVHRHIQNHLIPKVKSELIARGQAQDEVVDDGFGALEELQALSARSQCLPLYKKLIRLARTAERERDWATTRAFLSEARQTLELGARVFGEFMDRPAAVGNIHLSVILPRAGDPNSEAIEVEATVVEQ